MIGLKIGKYEIQAEIGRGGMGIVYQGVQNSLNRPVAIKVLPPELSQDKLSVERFIQEANLIAKLNDDNIIKIYDIEEKDGNYFIIMEYLHGTSLENIIYNSSISVSQQEMINYIIKVCNALDSSHKKGIIHRDVKSANIFITTDNKVKLMDFGISKIMSGRNTTTAGLAMGTPSYMSPEQARGETLDHLTDIYSLGVVLYECLTASLPFNGEDMFSVAYKHITESPPLPSKINHNIPSYIEKTCMVALRKDKNSRFQAGLDMANALRGKFPDYLSDTSSFVDKQKDFFSNLIKDRSFLPGVTIISILIMILIIQHYNFKKQDTKNDSFLAENKDVTILNSEPSVEIEVELQKIDVAIDFNQLIKAKQMIVKLKTSFSGDYRLQKREQKLISKIQLYSKKRELQKLIARKEKYKAFKLALYLNYIYPGDPFFESKLELLFSTFMDIIEFKEPFEELIDLNSNKEYEQLLEQAKYYVSTAKDKQLFSVFIRYAELVISKINYKNKVRTIIERITFFKESDNLEDALKELNTAMIDYPDSYELKLEHAVLIEEIHRRDLSVYLKSKDSQIAKVITKMLEAFSNKDVGLYLTLLNSKQDEFFLSEKRNVQSLFNITKKIFSYIKILEFVKDEDSAKILVTWELKSSFFNSFDVSTIFKNKGYIELVFIDGSWLINNFIWIK